MQLKSSEFIPKAVEVGSLSPDSQSNHSQKDKKRQSKANWNWNPKNDHMFCVDKYLMKINKSECNKRALLATNSTYASNLKMSIVDQDE